MTHYIRLWNISGLFLACVKQVMVAASSVDLWKVKGWALAKELRLLGTLRFARRPCKIRIHKNSFYKFLPLSCLSGQWLLWNLVNICSYESFVLYQKTSEYGCGSHWSTTTAIIHHRVTHNVFPTSPVFDVDLIHLYWCQLGVGQLLTPTRRQISASLKDIT